ncbi:MAG: RecX family transcriptional regulator [Chitinophagaceae bacterium]|nr:MAG: RecX family transcriptional regulator [Chitinophagaceae bacterium]
MRSYKKPGSISVQEALNKIQKYCAWQERCQSDVIQKLNEYGLAEKDINTVLKSLIQEKFVNDSRYADAVVRGKHNQNNWGKMKIIHFLKQKNIDESDINKALKSIPEKAYKKTLESLAKAKYASLKDEDSYIRIIKTKKYLYQKGYEIDDIESSLNKINRK